MAGHYYFEVQQHLLVITYARDLDNFHLANGVLFF